MLIDVKGKLPSIGTGALKKHLEETVLEGLPSDALRAAVKRALDESVEGGEKRLRVMPNSWLSARQQSGKGDREGCIVIGDAWNMRHPLTGGEFRDASPSFSPPLLRRDPPFFLLPFFGELTFLSFFSFVFFVRSLQEE